MKKILRALLSLFVVFGIATIAITVTRTEVLSTLLVSSTGAEVTAEDSFLGESVDSSVSSAKSPVPFLQSVSCWSY